VGEVGSVTSEAKQIERCHSAGGGVVLGVALGLVAVGIAHHPASIQGAGCQWRADVSIALRVGMLAGLVLGTVHVANHVIEAFVPNRHVALIISSVLLMLALFGAAGSAAWERTRSFTLAVIAGVWCAMVAMLILLCFAFSFNLAFEACVELQLYWALAATSMNDPGAFVVRNSLEAASERLVCMPAFAMSVSLAGRMRSVSWRARSCLLWFR